MEGARRPYVRILEQPMSKAMRFRYECEGRNAGPIIGINSTTETKSYPRIQVVGYKGPAVVIVSCVTHEEPYKPHPYNIVAKDQENKGVYQTRLESDDMTLTLEGLGIQCVKKVELGQSLKAREDLAIDPFKSE